MQKQNHEPKISNNFLNLWTKSLSEITDAPEIFLTFSGISLLPGVLNKFFFRFPRRTHLNLYILLPAPSTYYKKSTCIYLVGDYLERCNSELRLPESFMPEALYKIVSVRPRGLILWSELSQRVVPSPVMKRLIRAFLEDVKRAEDEKERRHGKPR